MQRSMPIQKRQQPWLRTRLDVYYLDAYPPNAAYAPLKLSPSCLAGRRVRKKEAETAGRVKRKWTAQDSVPNGVVMLEPAV